MTNPFRALLDAWDDIDKRIDAVAAEVGKGDEDVTKSMAMLRDEVYKLRSDFEVFTRRFDDALTEQAVRTKAVMDTVDSHHGSHTMPTEAAVEGLKAGIRTHDSAVAGLTSKVQELAAQLQQLTGVVHRG